MKTRDELASLKEEFEELNRKLAELSEEELAQVAGGSDIHDITKKDIDRGGIRLP